MQLAHQSDSLTWQMSLVLAFYRSWFWPMIVRLDTGLIYAPVIQSNRLIYAPVIQSNHAHMLSCYNELITKDKHAPICRASWLRPLLQLSPVYLWLPCLSQLWYLFPFNLLTSCCSGRGVHGHGQCKGHNPKIEMWTLTCLCPEYIADPSGFEHHSRHACWCWYHCK